MLRNRVPQFLDNLRMGKTNINALVQSIERSLHLIHKYRFSFKQQAFKQNWPEFQSIISLTNLSIRKSWQVGLRNGNPWHIQLRSQCLCFCAELQALQLLRSNSPGEIPRALASTCIHVNFRTRDVGLDCCFQTTCSTMSRRRGGPMGNISFVRMGRRGVAESRWADTLGSPTCWDSYLSLPVPGRNRNAQRSLHQQLDR